MKYSRNRILLIYMPGDKCSHNIRQFLELNNFEIINPRNPREGIKIARESYVDLVICQHEHDKIDGIQIYNSIKSCLVNKAIPFFLHICEFRKDYILKGLELGIDNFLVSPVNKALFLNKIENQLQKRSKLNLFRSEKYRYMFETIPEAKCISKNEDIILINNEFSRLTGVDINLKPYPKFFEIFEFKKNEKNDRNYYKCISGFDDYCLLSNVPIFKNRSKLFDIYITHSNYFGYNIFFYDIIPLLNPLSECKSSNKYQTLDKIPVKLTFREKEILNYSMQGYEIKQIANMLKISCRTVEKHRSNVMEKTGTHNIIESIFYFHKRGLISQIEKVN